MDPRPPTVRFPPVAHADPDGLLAVSRDLDSTSLLHAYRHGIFPWTDDPVGWFAPAQRGVLLPPWAHFPRNFGRLMRRANFGVRFDGAFPAVVAACRAAHAHEGEWLTPRFCAAYEALWRAGHAHSVEVVRNGELVGGLYGVQVGGMFSAESMFAGVDNASKAAVWALLAARTQLGIAAVDVQVLGETTAKLGARAVPRATFMQLLAACSTTFAERAGRRWPEGERRLVDTLQPTAPDNPDNPTSSAKRNS